MKLRNIQINQEEALRYAGHRRGNLTEELQKLFDQCCDLVQSLAEPRMVSRTFSIGQHKPVQLLDTDLILEGDDIASLLADATSCILFAVTIGNRVESAIRNAQVTDITKALFLDACASAAVESACEEGERQLRETLEGPPPFLTRRYSPGYGDLPLTLQKPILRLLDAGRKIGLSVSASGLLTPRKSVTAIMGLCRKPTKKEQGCAVCSNRETCLYRKEGISCGSAESNT